jgi:hypothetical protein
MNGGQEQLWVDWPELAHGHDVEVTEPRAPAIAFRCTHGAIYDSAQQGPENSLDGRAGVAGCGTMAWPITILGR